MVTLPNQFRLPLVCEFKGEVEGVLGYHTLQADHHITLSFVLFKDAGIDDGRWQPALVCLDGLELDRIIIRFRVQNCHQLLRCFRLGVFNLDRSTLDIRVE